MGYKIFVTVFTFIVFYIVAFIANKDYREPDDILYISRRQWRSILILMGCALIGLII